MQDTNNNLSRAAGAPTLSVYLTVRDSEKSIAFYEKGFGFKLKDAAKGESGKIEHVEMTFEDALIMFAPEGAFGGISRAPKTSGTEVPIIIYLYCRDVDAIYKSAIAAGAMSVMVPDDMFWGDRMCRVNDPDGYTWCFAKAAKK